MDEKSKTDSIKCKSCGSRSIDQKYHCCTKCGLVIGVQIVQTFQDPLFGGTIRRQIKITK